MGVRRNFSRVG